MKRVCVCVCCVAGSAAASWPRWPSLHPLARDACTGQLPAHVLMTAIAQMMRQMMKFSAFSAADSCGAALSVKAE